MRMRKSLLVLLVLLSPSSFAAAAAPKGRVATWSSGVAFPIDVQLPAFTKGVLKNDLVEMVNLPANLQPTADGSYSFDVADDRFAFVHAYYYATQEIATYNQLLESLFHKQLTGVKVSLSRAPDGTAPFAGGGGIFAVTVMYSKPAFDVSILAHEIGHEIHRLLLGKPLTDVYELPPSDFNKFDQQAGVIEGTANLLAAFSLGRSKIGEYDLYEGAFDLDTFVRFPDKVPLFKDNAVLAVNSPNFAAHYPVSIEQARARLANPTAAPSLPPGIPDLRTPLLSLPEPYRASAVINQPLWHAAVAFGFHEVQVLYLQTLNDLKTFSSYSDLANQLLEDSRGNPDLRAYLHDEYKIRGLAVRDL